MTDFAYHRNTQKALARVTSPRHALLPRSSLPRDRACLCPWARETVVCSCLLLSQRSRARVRECERAPRLCSVSDGEKEGGDAGGGGVREGRRYRHLRAVVVTSPTPCGTQGLIDFGASHRCQNLGCSVHLSLLTLVFSWGLCSVPAPSQVTSSHSPPHFWLTFYPPSHSLERKI